MMHTLSNDDHGQSAASMSPPKSLGLLPEQQEFARELGRILAENHRREQLLQRPGDATFQKNPSVKNE